jgi:hypothetical protein
MLGMPFEIITMLGSGILSGVLALWSQNLKAKAQSHQFMVERLSAERAATQDAREYGHKNQGFSFTRRTIAILAVFAVIVLPKLAALFGDVGVTVGYTEFNPGFWFFTEGQEVIKWRVASGFVITPLDTHFLSAVAGLYFGSSVVKNA